MGDFAIVREKYPDSAVISRAVDSFVGVRIDKTEFAKWD